MADPLPTNWQDNVGMVEDAAFLNAVGEAVNANTAARERRASTSVTSSATPAIDSDTYD